MPRRRPSWDEVYMTMAMTMATRSTCTLFQAGAVITSTSNRILATGYNGAPRDMASMRIGRTATCEDDCPRGRGEVERSSSYGLSCISVHAEANALLFVDRTLCEGGTLYVNGISCGDCLKLIANSGIRHVVALNDRSTHRTPLDASRFLRRCNIEMRIIPTPVVL